MLHRTSHMHSNFYYRKSISLHTTISHAFCFVAVLHFQVAVLFYEYWMSWLMSWHCQPLLTISCFHLCSFLAALSVISSSRTSLEVDDGVLPPLSNTHGSSHKTTHRQYLSCFQSFFIFVKKECVKSSIIKLFWIKSKAAPFICI